jgi:hypothetical protein
MARTAHGAHTTSTTSAHTATTTTRDSCDGSGRLLSSFLSCARSCGSSVRSVMATSVRPAPGHACVHTFVRVRVPTSACLPVLGVLGAGLLQRLLDARSLPVRAVAALVVSRHSFSTWEPESPQGQQLLRACCEIVRDIPDVTSSSNSRTANATTTASASAAAGAAGREDDDDDDDSERVTSYEHAAEALSVLCMRYEAKATMMPAVGSLVRLAKRGNERSSVWLALAVIFGELATCQHHKNETKAREMEMTAEQFETLQMCARRALRCVAVLCVVVLWFPAFIGR